MCLHISEIKSNETSYFILHISNYTYIQLNYSSRGIDKILLGFFYWEQDVT